MPNRKTKRDKNTIKSAATMIAQLQPRTKLSRQAFIKEIIKSYGEINADDCADCSDCSDCVNSNMNMDELINPVP